MHRQLKYCAIVHFNLASCRNSFGANLKTERYCLFTTLNITLGKFQLMPTAQTTVRAPSVCGVGARGQEEYKESERSLAASGNDFFWLSGLSKFACLRAIVMAETEEALTAG